MYRKTEILEEIIENTTSIDSTSASTSPCSSETSGPNTPEGCTLECIEISKYEFFDILHTNNLDSMCQIGDLHISYGFKVKIGCAPLTNRYTGEKTEFSLFSAFYSPFQTLKRQISLYFQQYFNKISFVHII